MMIKKKIIIQEVYHKIFLQDLYQNTVQKRVLIQEIKFLQQRMMKNAKVLNFFRC